MRWIGLLAAVALLALTMPVPEPTEAADASVCDPNAKPADFSVTIKDMHGKDVKLASYKGKVILFDFWATWCGPCKIEIPWFIEFYSKYQQQGLVVLGLSVDDPVSKLKPYAEQMKMNYPVLVGDGRDDVKEKAFGPLWGLPTTFLISRDGKICKKHVGISTKERFEREIKALL
jgi:peroxiredoxin